jgi:hypothetical protein
MSSIGIFRFAGLQDTRKQETIDAFQRRKVVAINANKQIR